MANTAAGEFIYENLRPIDLYNEGTSLCIYEPAHKLYVVKKVDLSCKPTYEALRVLNNPHLAKIIHIADKGDHIEVVREYVAGDTLTDLLKDGGLSDADAAVKITSGVCDGLSAMHKLGYVHRDVNPNNIIVSAGGCAVIIDFGIARSFSEDKGSDTTILGTPGYAAPEQFGFTQSDARTDIYAVGVLLNVMLTGNLPNIRQAGGSLGRIVQKCIEIDSRLRYKSIDDLKKAVYCEVAGDGRMDRIIGQIPGIRSKSIPVVILSVIGYLLVGILSVLVFAAVKNGAYFPTAVSWILSVLVPYFCFNNFLRIWDRLPFSRGATIKNQKTVYTVLGIVSILIGIVIFGLT